MTEEKGLSNKSKETEQKEQKILYERLKEYCSSDAYPFHMPGHKRNKTLIKELLGGVYGDGMPYQIDITEIDGFDNLHHAEGILLEGQKRAADLYGAEESFYLINGSTCGILASVFACTAQKGKILMARNCHKAVYHAVELRELETVYLYPQLFSDGDTIWQGAAQMNGPIDPADVEQALKRNSGIEAVMITSPTYDGVVSDVKRIAEIAHNYKIPLIVDEAHGAHFGFHPYFPENSLKQEADLVIHSLHKTLPSLTQTALLHRGKNSLVSSERVKKYLDIFETSSPSYVFMAGMDQCIRLIKERGAELFELYARRIRLFQEETAHLAHIHLLPDRGRVPDGSESNSGTDDKNKRVVVDPGKLVIAADGLTGQELAEILRKEYHLEVEMAAAGYVIALTSLADTEEGFLRLKNALIHIDEMLSTTYVERLRKASTETCNDGQVKQAVSTENDYDAQVKQTVPTETGYAGEVKKTVPTETSLGRDTKQVMMIAEAAGSNMQTVDLADSAGRVCGEYIYLYPPGIPLAVPGEQITEKLIAHILDMQQKGLEIQGLRDYTGKKVDVCRKV